MKTVSKVVNHLGQLTKFRNLSRDELFSLAECIDMPAPVEAEEILCTQGEISTTAFIVITGELIGTMKFPGGSEEEIGRYRPGDIVGEISLIEISPRAMTVEASCTSDVLVIDKDRLDALRAKDNSGAYKFLHIVTQTLCDRLRENNLRARSKYFGKAIHTPIQIDVTPEEDPLDRIKTAFETLKTLLLKKF